MKPRKQDGNKPMTKQYLRTMAFMGETFRRSDDLTADEREARLHAMAEKARR